MNALHPPRTIATAALCLLLSCSAGHLGSDGCPSAGPCCPAGVVCRNVQEPEPMPEKLPGTSVDDAPIKAGTTRAKRASVLQLNYRVLDAGFSSVEVNGVRVGRLVMISNSPSNAVHIVNLLDGSDLVVPLQSEPRTLSVVPSATAFIGFDRRAMSIDVITGTTFRICRMSIDVMKAGASGSNKMYVVPKTDGDAKLHIIEFDSGCRESEVAGVNEKFGRSPGLAVHPGADVVFLTGSGGRLTRCNTRNPSETSCDDTLPPSEWSKYDFCNHVLPVVGGTRLFTGCGVVLNVEGRPDISTCSYAGRFGATVRAKHLFEASETGRVTMIPAPSGSSPGPQEEPDDDTVVETFDTGDLTVKERYGLPQVPLATGSALAHGRFAFSHPKLSNLYVVAETGRPEQSDRSTVIVTLEL